MKRGYDTIRTVIILACLVALFLFMGYETPTASAQVLYGSIVGTVTDPTGSVISKANVTVTNTATGLARTASADDVGYYSIQNLPQGAYDLSVSAAGFRPLKPRPQPRHRRRGLPEREARHRQEDGRDVECSRRAEEQRDRAERDRHHGRPRANCICMRY